MQRAVQSITSTAQNTLSSITKRTLYIMSSNTATPNPNTSRGRSYRPRRGGGGLARGRGHARPYPNMQESPLDAVHVHPVAGTRGIATSTTVAAATAARPAAIPTAAVLPEETRSASPTTNNRHFSERRFADAPISNESKAGLKHECVAQRLSLKFYC